MSRSLKATVGATAAATLLYYVPTFEGMVLRGYKDPIGIVTACSGHTKTAVLGRPYSKAECLRLLESDLAEHADGVLDCTPELKGHIPQLAAAVSFAFNVGVTKYCNSTMAEKFSEGDLSGGCEEIPKWRKPIVNGEPLPGIIKRRTAEHDLCVDGLT